MATVVVSATAFDACGLAELNGTGVYEFPLGIHSLTLTAVDVNGNISEHLFTVYVHDDLPPTAELCPADLTIGIETAAGFIPPAPVFTDNCGIFSLINDAPADFPAGTTTVNWTATDNYGLTAVCSYDVTVTAEPIITFENLQAISASVSAPELLTRATWNPPLPQSPCADCAETDYPDFAYLGIYYGQQYFLYTGERTDWHTAADLAVGLLDGHLARLKTRGENNFVRHHLPAGADSLWLGLYEHTDPQTGVAAYLWADDTPADYDNFGDALDIGEGSQAVVMTAEGLWKPAAATDLCTFIVQRPCTQFSQIAPVLMTENAAGEMLPEVQQSGAEWSVGTYTITYRGEDRCGNMHTDFFPLEVSSATVEYCPTGGIDSTLWIAQFNLGGDRHDSSDTKQYADYTEEILEPAAADGYADWEVVIGGNAENQELYLRLWADKDNDGDFFGAEELIWEGMVENNLLQTQIPTAHFSAAGSRLRVAVARYDFPDVCADFFSGEAEDYFVVYDATEAEAQFGIIPVPAGAAEQSEALTVSVVPNPTAGSAILHLPASATATELHIFSAAGSRIFSVTLAPGVTQHRLDFTDWNSGIYLLSVATAGKRKYGKVVIER